MTKREAIEQAVKDLLPNELEQFRAWFEEFEAVAFDSKIEPDARRGKLDRLAEAALREFREGRAREI
ncbi:MAG: hypothetical protein JOZ84_10690 [Methylobacteriaceae bacterium]|nr:hypothetical protein [Methylobacteriaceae bacterium]